MLSEDDARMPPYAEPTCALVLVDVQQGFEHPKWGRRNNAAADRNIVRLLAAWKTVGAPVVYVRHDSDEPGSPLAPGAVGNKLKGYMHPEPDLVVSKRVNSAFLGEPNLDAWLRERDIVSIVIGGITTNHCCETTARMAGNLGYRTLFVIDATYTFDRVALDGSVISADDLMRVTAANLHDEFAQVVRTTDAVA